VEELWAEQLCLSVLFWKRSVGGRKECRKGLSKEDQEAFDHLFDRAKFHTSAAVYMSHAWPLETILLSICLEHEKMLREVMRKLNERNNEHSGRTKSDY